MGVQEKFIVPHGLCVREPQREREGGLGEITLLVGREQIVCVRPVVFLDCVIFRTRCVEGDLA